MNDPIGQTAMETKKGIPVSSGIAFAPAVVIDAEDYRIPRRHLLRSEIKDELVRVRKALYHSINIEAIKKNPTAKNKIMQYILDNPELMKKAMDYIKNNPELLKKTMSLIGM